MKSKHHNFIQRTIINFLEFFKNSLFFEEHALRESFMQNLSPHIKFLGIFLIVLLTILMKNILAIAVLYLICLLFALTSRIEIGYFLKRTCFFVPIFAVFIALPAFFADFNFALVFVARILTCVSWVILLALTTSHTKLLNALRCLGIPQIFVMTIGMCYRYIFLFAEVIENTYFAIKSRVGGRVHYKHGQYIASWNIAQLWNKSLELNKQVYEAMLSRGYTGEPKVLNE